MSMSKDVVLGGYLVDAGGVRCQLPVTLNPSNLTIENAIRNVSSAGKGVVVLRHQQASDSGPYELEMYVDAGNFLLMLNVLDEHGDQTVKTLTNKDVASDLIVILGEKYPAKAATRDVEIVCAIFNEFAQSGNVSTDLMS